MQCTADPASMDMQKYKPGFIHQRPGDLTTWIQQWQGPKAAFAAEQYIDDAAGMKTCQEKTLVCACGNSYRVETAAARPKDSMKHMALVVV